MSSKLCNSRSSQDQLLEDLIIRLEETEESVGLTLCVNGLIIAGDMISSKKYFDKMSTFFEENSITIEDTSLMERGLPYPQ
jgi:hypothetical protein